MEEIDLFLTDIRDGHYDGKPVLDINVQNLENEALRAKYKLDKKATGVLIRRIRNRDNSYPLHVGDIITRISDHPIDNAGMVHVEGDRMIKFQYLIQRSAHANQLPLLIVRDSKEVKLDVPVKPFADSLFLHLSQVPIPYFVFGPLVFSEASSDYVLYMTGYGNSTKDVSSTGGYGFLSMLYTSNPPVTATGRPFPTSELSLSPSQRSLIKSAKDMTSATQPR